MPAPTRAPVPLGRSSQSARASRQPGESVRMAPVCRIAAREPARATNAGGAAAHDECVGRARGRSIRSLRNRLLGGERRPWRPSLLARCAALNQLLGRTAAAPQRGRPVRTLGQQPARARLVAPLGCRGADHAARITVRAAPATRLCRPTPVSVHVAPPVQLRRGVSPATLPPTPPPPHATHYRHHHPRLPVSPVSHCALPPARRRIPRSFHRQQQPSPPDPDAAPLLLNSVGMLPRAVLGGGRYSSERGECGRAPLGRLLMGLAQARVRKLAFSNVFQRDVLQRESME